MTVLFIVSLSKVHAEIPLRWPHTDRDIREGRFAAPPVEINDDFLYFWMTH